MNVLITGASGAIGQAIAKALCGHNVILQYNTNPIANGVKCDLRNEDEVAKMFEQIGDIDVLVNNAGKSSFDLLQDMSLQKWNDIMATNLTSAFLCSKYAIPKMVAKQSGHIINIGSMWGEVGASCEVCYSASKGGLIAFTKALSKELAPSNILVNCISPGIIESPMNARLSEEELEIFKQEIPLARQGKAREVAKLVAFLAEKNTYITGQDIAINGGYC